MEMSIELLQKPVIKHQLQIIGEQVTKRIEELNIDNLVANEDTLQVIKSLMADLNSELKDFEDRRKFVKNEIAKPYNEFKTVYKEEITEKYNSAIEKLKAKIDSVEVKIKQEKKAGIIKYFDELCLDSKIDFIKFENTGMEINLSTSIKQYKERCFDFVKKVNDDIQLINSDEFAAEIYVEYKKTLNASSAITTIRERKQKEKEEKARLKQAQTDSRVKMLHGLLLVYHDMTKTYNHVKDDNIMISLSDIENLSNDEFLKAFVELESKANALKDPEKQTTGVKAPEPLKPPVQEEKKQEEKKFIAVFEVTGTMGQLKQLGEYLKLNNITYKNL